MTPQTPLGSGFGAASAAAEVIHDCDLVGKVDRGIDRLTGRLQKGHQAARAKAPPARLARRAIERRRDADGRRDVAHAGPIERGAEAQGPLPVGLGSDAEIDAGFDTPEEIRADREEAPRR